MDTQKKSAIYERLLALNFQVEQKTLPDPQYINSKLGECHFFIEEISRFAIELGQEISVFDRCLSTSEAQYESAKENLLINDEDIKDLPNIKDREAKANSKLKNEINEIRGFKNELSDLNNLLRSVNLKLRNLNRVNTDIKIQLRLMEAQIKLGTPSATDPAARGLLEELRRSQTNMDMFRDSMSTLEHNPVMDTTKPIDMATILKNPDDNLLSDDSEEDEQNSQELLGEPWTKEEPISEEVMKEVDVASCMDAKTIDLDKIMDEKTEQETPKQKGGDPGTSPEPVSKPETKTEEPKKIKGEIDIDALLSQFK